ncbi:MAG: bifunctional riboflavin kinase/FAD synthetase [Lachnospiraceae bacterium]
MRVISGTRQFHIDEPTIVTIGKFDGRHKGHQKLLREMMRLKQEYGFKTSVFTFDMSPAGVVTGQEQTVITTNMERRSRMESIGIDYLVEYPFDDQAAHMTPETFVREVLTGAMNAKAIVAGTDCRFGYRRAGDAALLGALSDRYGYQAVIIEKEQDDHRDISSTYIREELDKGNIEKANKLLGEPYSIHGTVIHGNHIGSSLGFPTANIIPPSDKHLPPFGVYVSTVRLNGQSYGGVSNIGRKPTIHGDNPIGIETYIMDMEADLYGKEITIQLLHFCRPEQKFESLDALKLQVEKDKRAAADYINKRKTNE